MKKKRKHRCKRRSGSIVPSISSSEEEESEDSPKENYPRCPRIRRRRKPKRNRKVCELHDTGTYCYV